MRATRFCATRLGVLCATSLALFAADAASAQTGAPLPPRAMEQIRAILAEKAQRTGAQRKMDSRLIIEMKRRRRDPLLARLPRLRASLDVRSDGATLVDIDGQITGLLEQRIRALGGTVVGSYPEWSTARAWVPMAALEALAVHPDVRWLRPAAVMHTNVTTAGDNAHFANLARGLFGADGTGVKICVISDGVDALTSLQASGELPSVDVLPGLRGSGSEGTAMLEIIHDLAPGARLGFATGIGGMGAMASSILALRSAGCQVIVDDLGFADEPAFQDGTIARAVTTVVGSSSLLVPGVVYVSAAGNDGGLSRGTSSTWEGDFRGFPIPLGNAFVLFNDFGGGTIGNRILRDPKAIVLSWSDPDGGSANDYDLLLFAGADVVDVSDSIQDGTQSPLEIIDSRDNDDTGLVALVLQTSAADRFLRLSAFVEGQLTIQTRGAIFGHPAAREAIAVAAAAAGTDPMVRFPLSAGFVESFSSDGPRRIFFSPDGVPLTPGNFSSTGGRLIFKPDLVGADDVATATPGFQRFQGTSAAAPHIAAIAGLVLSASLRAPNPGPAPVPFVAATGMNLFLQDTAVRRGGPTGVFDEGFGVVNALAAVQGAAAGLPCFDLIDNDGDGLVDVLRDPGCASSASATEAPPCDDRIDNDEDGLIDLADRGCSSPSDNDECGNGAMQSLAVLPLLAYLRRRRHTIRTTRDS